MLVLDAGRLAEHAAEIKGGEPISLPIYFDQLTAHDWGFEWSDDPGAFKAGQAAKEQLRRDSALSPEHKALYQAFERHHVARNYQLQTVSALPTRPL